jgi:type I restriction enzyme S subunit
MKSCYRIMLVRSSCFAESQSDMDSQLGALEARRAKTALLKQGMMQELLTGRTRLA